MATIVGKQWPQSYRNSGHNRRETVATIVGKQWPQSYRNSGHNRRKTVATIVGKQWPHSYRNCGRNRIETVTTIVGKQWPHSYRNCGHNRIEKVTKILLGNRFKISNACEEIVHFEHKNWIKKICFQLHCQTIEQWKRRKNACLFYLFYLATKHVRNTIYTINKKINRWMVMLTRQKAMQWQTCLK